MDFEMYSPLVRSGGIVAFHDIVPGPGECWRCAKVLELFQTNIDGAKIVADVGCGTGAFGKALACGKRLVIVLDVEEGALRKTKNSWIGRVCAGAHHLPLRGGSADCVLALAS